jgi:hypothetical protein
MSELNLVSSTNRNPKFESFAQLSSNELKYYSIFLGLFVFAGFIFHFLVLCILLYRKLKRRCFKYEKTVDYYSNYVSYAFMLHQALVDWFRLIYAMLYTNRMLNDYRSSATENLTADNLFSELDSFYDLNCTKVATLYSVLTMVTIVNILTLLISETCRFYDLKFNSNDTSNYCCVIFGIMLIWVSSLIVISSLMLVGVADSVAPTWKCNLNDEESATRALVINIVWFFLVLFVLFIGLSHSISLLKELNSLNLQDNRFTLYTVNASLMAFKAEHIERNIKIVKETTNRLFILMLLALVFFLSFMPNFVMTILKNVLSTKTTYFQSFSILSSMINLSNATFNSIILFVLCKKSHYSLRSAKSFRNGSKSIKEQLRQFLMSIILPNRFQTVLNQKHNDDEITESCNPNSLIETCIDKVYDEHSFTMLKCQSASSNNQHSHLSRNMETVKDFYSKIGNRLGNQSD